MPGVRAGRGWPGAPIRGRCAIAPFRYTQYQPDPAADAAIRDRSVLFIDNDVALQALSMDDCLESLETVYQDIVRGYSAESRNTFHTPRTERGGWHYWRTMSGTSATLGVAVVRVISVAKHETPGSTRIEGYSGVPGKHMGLIYLFDVQDGTPLAIIADGHIQHMRVAAVGGLSVKYMAREDASVLGLFGTSGMADTHAWAISRARPLTRIQVYSPNPEHRASFTKNMSEFLDVEVVPVDTPEQVVEGADILATCTNSRVPVVRGEWLKPGMHVLSIYPGELDDDVLRRADRYAYSRSQADQHHFASPDERPPHMQDTDPDTNWLAREHHLLSAGAKSFLGELALDGARGRTDPDQITCFTSQGNAVQFAPVALKVYERAREQGLGHQLPLSWFLEDIRM